MQPAEANNASPESGNSGPLPLLSVIIPFKDNHEEVLEIESRLREQTYPADKTELIFIDNASSRPHHFPDAFLQANRVLKEADHPNSPYSARNRGVEAAEGDVMVFLDANSTPDLEWLMNGIICMNKTGHQLIAGRVDFDFGSNVTAAKVVDALTSIQMKKAVEQRHVAYTANLFIKREVFDDAGLFEEGVRSGGDVRFCMKAAKSGFSIGYCEWAVIFKKARNTRELYQKKFRTGKGYYDTWLSTDPKKRTTPVFNFLRAIKPPSLNEIKKEKFIRDLYITNWRLTTIYFHLYSIRIVEQTGFLVAYIKHKLG